MKHYETPDHWRGGRTPNGSTDDYSTYVHEWKELRDKIEELTGARCYGWDPDLALEFPSDKRGGGYNPTAHIPVWLAKNIIERCELKVKNDNNREN